MAFTALVTGSNGFCGRHLTQLLCETGRYDVVGVDREAASSPAPACALFDGLDITDSEGVDRVIRRRRPDLLFHLAGMGHGDERQVYRVNVIGTANLLDSVRRHVPDCRVLLVGSAAEYGLIAATDLPVTEEACCRPSGAYGLSKHCATRIGLDYVQRHGLRIVIARPFNIVGPGMPDSLVLGAIIGRAREALSGGAEHPFISIGNLQTQRDFIAIGDVVDLYVRMLQSDHWGEVFNVCSGHPVRILTLVQLALQHAPRPIELRVDPALVRPSDVPIVYGSNDKARLLLGFIPGVDLADSVSAAWHDAMNLGVGR